MSIVRTGERLQISLRSEAFFNASNHPDVAMRSDGRGMVVWHEDDRGVVARLIDTDGNLSTREFDLDRKIGGYHPEVNALRYKGFDGYLVTWESYDTSSHLVSYHAQRVDVSGKTVGGAKLLFKSAYDASNARSVATLSNGNFVVVSDEGTNALCRIFSPNGALLKQYQPAPPADGSTQVAEVAALSDGGFVMTWEALSGTMSASKNSLMGQTFSARGTALKQSVLLEQDGSYIGAKVTGLAKGGYAVAYVSEDGLKVDVKLVTAGGTVAKTAVIGTAGQHVGTGQVNLSALSDGSVAVAWQTTMPRPEDNRIFVQHVGTDGKLLGSPVTFNDAADYTEPLRTEDASLVSAGNGQFVVVGGQNDGVSIGTDQIAARFFGIEHRIGASNKANTIIGTSGTDVVDAKGGNDRIDGKGGADILKGGSGNDTILGGAGMDHLEGGGGNDTIHGGSGIDRIYGDSGNDTIDGGDGFDIINGGADRDTVTYAASKTAVYLDDTMFSQDKGRNSDALSGVEKVVGSRLGDHLAAFDYGLTLSGAGGRDTLIAAFGCTMTGGADKDVFEFRLFPGSGLSMLLGDFTVTDFEGGKGSGDVFRFDKRVIANDAAVFAAAKQVKDDVVIKFKSSMGPDIAITLEHEKLSKLHADDFSFF